jgi:hypothetical protein
MRSLTSQINNTNIYKMLEYSDLTVYKNTNGVATALGCPINSFLLQNEKPLFVGGGKKKDKNDQEHDYDNLAVPAGLVCMTQTVCRRPLDELEANELEPTPYEENELVPDSLYERLMELAEVKEKKKMTKKHKPKANTHKPKSSTRKHKKN